LIRKYSILLALAVLALVALVGPGPVSEASADDDDDDLRTYRVTIENETDEQPFSPGVALTHRKSVNLFRVGQQASLGIERIAEDGNQGPSVTAAMGAQGVTDVFDINQPTTREETTFMSFTDEFTFEIQARARDRLSLAIMLICTNDGFTGLDSVKLPKDDDSVTYRTQGYDAGTENNTEQSEDIVDPCSALGPAPLAGDPNDPNGGIPTSPQAAISHHPGILGGGDLTPSLHNWENPVAEITIELIDDDDDDEEDDD
jgi:Spondin_N